MGKKTYWPIILIMILAIISVIFVKKGMELILIAGIIAVPGLIYCMKKPKTLVYFQLIYNFLIKYMISDFGVPGLANYLTDIITVLCVIFAVRRFIIEKTKINFKMQIFVVILMLFSSLLGLVINGQKPILYIWGFRNIYRFFAFFFASIIILDKEDIKKILKIFKVFLYINIILCTYQYFVLSLPQDNISGTFGTLVGGNRKYEFIFNCCYDK